MSTGNGPGTRSDYSMQLHNFFQKEENRGDGSRLAFSEAGMGPAHKPSWTIKVHIDGQVLGCASDVRKQVAKNWAAREAMAKAGIPFLDE
ncbi:hypothetical protein DACRYDRAFT_109464 [Dacryopinax primogenitus]|uniref:DRBM domain-containing protein n=1 Tax=Dacryopinax primogenitus (strain DJM 731) TaxID=1858805 RepID=M5FRZ3_DACPD|nr:uncharacterized protein DACRYDRAFT_109464 [Dacryopinax primogenitus]EJU00041.1 hypothetical protein DACRYDRAFT_109464 [Dacryopinax primogenitus]